MIILKSREKKIISDFNINKIVQEKGFDRDNLRLNVGGGDVRYSNCINLELEPHPDVDADMYGDIRKGIEVPDETFVEVLLIHVIEHIERINHSAVLSEIWRILKPNGRLILDFPDFIEVAKRFIENKFGARWSLYNYVLYGRQSRKGDYHVTAMEQQDITDRLFLEGFKDVKYSTHSINATVVATKGEKNASQQYI